VKQARHLLVGDYASSSPVASRVDYSKQTTIVRDGNVGWRTLHRENL